MKIHIHDFSGHPFQFELSAKFAEAGYIVCHSYCDDFVTGKSSFRSLNKSDNLSIRAISLHTLFPKYSYLKRVIYEIRFALKLAKYNKQGKYDLIIISNLPLISEFILYLLLPTTKKVLWHQDIYSLAMNSYIKKKIGSVAKPLSILISEIERYIVRNSSKVIAISEAFTTQYQRWNIPESRYTVIENWAANSDFYPVQEIDDSILVKYDLKNLRPLIYAGTLGLKHNMKLLKLLEKELNKEVADFIIIVISSKASLTKLKESIDDNQKFLLLDFRPIEELKHIFSKCEWGIAMLEDEASAYSVPSKVLSYIGCGLPVIALMQRENLASRIVMDCAGQVFNPTENGVKLAVETIRKLSPSERNHIKQKCIDYRNKHFDIGSKYLEFIKALDIKASG